MNVNPRQRRRLAGRDPAEWSERVQIGALVTLLATWVTVALVLPESGAALWLFVPLIATLIWRFQGDSLLYTAMWTIPLGGFLAVSLQIPQPLGVAASVVGIVAFVWMLFSARAHDAWLHLVSRDDRDGLSDADRRTAATIMSIDRAARDAFDTYARDGMADKLHSGLSRAQLSVRELPVEQGRWSSTIARFASWLDSAIEIAADPKGSSDAGYHAMKARRIAFDEALRVALKRSGGTEK